MVKQHSMRSNLHILHVIKNKHIIGLTTCSNEKKRHIQNSDQSLIKSIQLTGIKQVCANHIIYHQKAKSNKKLGLSYHLRLEAYNPPEQA